MFRVDNFISFHDLTPEARFLWVSPTIYDLLGYQPEDLIGTPAYDIVLPVDIADSKTAHKENVMNDLVATQVVVRYKCKDGRSIHFSSLFSLCYDFIVHCATMLDPGAEAYVQLRAHSSAMTRLVGSKKEEFERMRRHHEAFAANSWDQQAMEPEARVCLILNRFTRNLVVMYASSACDKVFHVDPDDITGKPMLLYIRADDLGPFVEQVNIIKASTAITQLRFWFQSPNWSQEIPCEAIVFGSADGIVAVVRRCRPFVRKHLIDYNEQFEASDRGSSSFSSDWRRSYGSSPGSSCSASPISPRYGSGSRFKPLSHQEISRAALDRIRIIDFEDNPRSLANLPDDDPSLVHESIAAAEVPAFKEVILQEYREDDDDSPDDGITSINCMSIRA
ncbi:hypothetical protein B0O80DRAFT_496244 [Mortierella sp. GBAus27b]|nr:hypothetical protein B0O80DRAFT_496244 [Mortierella sp. GBAus27b]